ncbi:MAG: DNA primase [Chloroflexota bacterium]|nr:DNA primase [Chloroflexota bacterium]
MTAIDEVKQRIDIVEVVGEYTALTKAGRTFRGLCPFHSEKHGSFFVYPDQQSWHCFGACSTGGDVFSFIMKKQGLSFGEALRLLADKAGVVLPTKAEPEAGAGKKDKLYQINQAAAGYFHDLLNSAAGQKTREYITGRGLTVKSVTDFQMGFSLPGWEGLKQHLQERGYTESELLEAGLVVEAGEGGATHDRFRNRLMFPICDDRGHIIGFGARALDNSPAKYINSPLTPIFDKSNTLYGLNLADSAIRQRDLAVIVEGYLDVIIAHQYGFSNVVASMGTAISDKHINALKRMTKNLVLALDSDTAGEEAMLRCVGYENALDSEIKVVILPEGRDPDEVIKDDTKQWEQLLAQALPVIDFTFDMVTAKLDLTRRKDQSLAVEKLLPIVIEVKDPIRRQHYMNELHLRTGIDQRILEETVGKMKARRRAKETRPETTTGGGGGGDQVLRHLLTNPVEGYCLSLLLQHPELKDRCQELKPEYFAGTQNREILIAYLKAKDVKSMREELDSSLRDYVDSLLSRQLSAAQIEPKFAECVLRLREAFLRSVESRKAEVLASAAESGGATAELAALEEHGISTSVQLNEVFCQKNPRRSGAKGLKK